jgi:hypothetical protein
MANKKITSLPALGATPATDDVLPIVDVSGTPTTKKVTVANLVAAAPQGDLLASNNLSDVANAGTSRTNLGLGTAAVANTGTLNGNVVALDSTGLPAVDGSQLTNVSSTDATKLAITSNLSDLNNAGTARTNLGLGTAATQNVGTSASNVVQLDGTSKLPAVDGSQLTNLPSGSVDGTQVTSTGETGATKFLREDGDGTCSFQNVDVDTPLNTALRGSDNTHIGANPEQTFKITDNPYSTISIVADEDGNLTYALKGASAEVRVVKGTSGTPLRFALSNELPAFILSNDTGEPDIEIEDPDGEKISVISGDSDTKGVNGLPIIQGYNLKTIGANPSPMLISGGTIS